MSVRTVERYMSLGKIEAVKRPNGHVRISQESIDAFLAGEPVHPSTSSPVSGTARVAPAAAGADEDAAGEDLPALVGTSGEATPHASPLTPTPGSGA